VPEFVPVRVTDVPLSARLTAPVVPAFAVRVEALVVSVEPVLPMPPPAVRVAAAVDIKLLLLALSIVPVVPVAKITAVVPLTVSALPVLPRVILPEAWVIESE